MRPYLLIALGFLAAPLAAHEFKLGDLVIDHPYALETARTAMAGAGYMEITNNGDTTDRLMSVTADFPKIEIHTVVMTDDGVARMRPLEAGLEIAPGETVALQPGGFHIMFMGLNGDPFEAGEAFGATLVFETAGALDVTFNIEPRNDETMQMDHSQHKMNMN
ncbi:MAG: copper chaperone PCu(A)C [Pseudomonadota bacterium]